MTSLRKKTEQGAPRIRSWRSVDILSATHHSYSREHCIALEEAQKVFRGGVAQVQAEQALRCERRKRRIHHHAYDLGRHIRLVRLSQEKAQGGCKFKE